MRQASCKLWNWRVYWSTIVSPPIAVIGVLLFLQQWNRFARFPSKNVMWFFKIQVSEKQPTTKNPHNKSAFPALQGPLSPDNKAWALKPIKGVQGGWENAIHISRRGWTYSSFCLKGCHFAEPRTERLSTCRQLRLTITGLYRNTEEFPVLCMCLPFGYSTFLRQILHGTSLLVCV